MSRETELELDLTAGPAGPEVSEHSLGWGVAWQLVRGGLRADLVPLLLVALLVAVAALTAAAGPAALRKQADQALRQDAGRQSLDDRSLVLTMTVTGSDRDATAFGDFGKSVRAKLTPTLRRVFPTQSSDHRAFDVPASDGLAQPGDIPDRLTLMADSRFPALVHYTQGGPPEQATVRPGEIPIAVTAQTAEKLDLSMGSRFKLGNPPPSLPGDTADHNDYAVVVGVFDRTVTGASSPDDAELWKQNAALFEPTMLRTPSGVPYLTGEVVVGEAGLSELVGNHFDITVGAKYRQTVDPAQLTAATVGALRRELTEFGQGTIRVLCPEGGVPGSDRCGELFADASSEHVKSGIPDLLARFQTDEISAGAVESFGFAGLLAVELAAVFAAARLVAARRSGMVALYRARGASRRQAALLLVIEALLVVGPATVLGYLSGGGSGPLWPPLVVAVFGICVVPLVVLRRSAPGAVVARSGAAAMSKARRRTLEALLVVLAAAGVLALRARGTAGTTVAGSVDPLMGAVPVLVGAVAALVLVKALPRPVLLAARVIGRTRSTAGWLGIVRAAERGQTLSVALAVLVLTLSGAVFGGTVLKTLSSGEQDSADRLGADAVVTNPVIGHDAVAHLKAIPSARAVQSITVFDRTITDEADGAQSMLRFLGVDEGLVPGVPGYDTVAGRWPTATASTASPVPSPAPLLPPSTGAPAPGFTDGTTPAGTDADPIPVLASPATQAAFPDGLITVAFDDRHPFTMRIVSVLPADQIPPALRTAIQGPGSMFVLLPTRTLALASDATDAGVVVITGPVSSAQIRDALVNTTGMNARIQVRAENLARMRAEGLSRSLTGVFVVCSGLAAAFAVLVMVLELAGTARERGKTVSFLRTMGLSSRAAGMLTAIQLIPTALAAAIGGALLGTVSPWLLGPALSLTAFTDGYEAPVRVDWRVTGALAAALVVVVGVAAAVEAVVSRRRRVAGALRVGE